MKILEQIDRNSLNGETIKFTIIGERIGKSLEIPMWGKSFVISDLEKAQWNNSDMYKKLKESNALEVFRQYYEETFNINP